MDSVLVHAWEISCIVRRLFLSSSKRTLLRIDWLLIVNVIFKTMIVVENVKKFFVVYLHGHFLLLVNFRPQTMTTDLHFRERKLAPSLVYNVDLSFRRKLSEVTRSQTITCSIWTKSGTFKMLFDNEEIYTKSSEEYITIYHCKQQFVLHLDVHSHSQHTKK